MNPWTRAAEDTEGLRECLALAATQSLEAEIHPARRWLEHLLWLRSGLETGTLEARMLTAEEAEGLRIIAEAGRELGRKLKKCPRCGGLSESYLACAHCGQSLLVKPASGVRG